MVVRWDGTNVSLLGQRKVDIDFDGRFGSSRHKLPATDGVFCRTGEHVVAADSFGSRDGAVGGYGGGDFYDAADFHALSQFGIGGGYALRDRRMRGQAELLLTPRQ